MASQPYYLSGRQWWAANPAASRHHVAAEGKAAITLHPEQRHKQHLHPGPAMLPAVLMRWPRVLCCTRIFLPPGVVDRLTYVYGGDVVRSLNAYFKLGRWSRQKGNGGDAAMDSLLTKSVFRIREFGKGLDSNKGETCQSPHRRPQSAASQSHVLRSWCNHQVKFHQQLRMIASSAA